MVEDRDKAKSSLLSRTAQILVQANRQTFGEFFLSKSHTDRILFQRKKRCITFLFFELFLMSLAKD